MSQAESSNKSLDQILADQKPEGNLLDVYIPALHFSIRIAEITFRDLAKLMQQKNTLDQAVGILMATWGKADSTVTKEKLLSLGAFKVAQICNAIAATIEASTGAFIKPNPKDARK